LKVRSLADATQPGSLAARARAKRFVFFRRLLDQLSSPIQILDIGGTSKYWRAMGQLPPDTKITLVNIAPQPADELEVIQGDARSLPDIDDGQFDVVFSNSVIEHVGGLKDQEAMAREVRRIGRRYFVQTPSLWFPLEPHALVPGFQFLPVRARAKLLQGHRLGHLPRCPDYATAEQEVRSIRLLTAAEMEGLFPEASVHRERVAGLTKSFMSVWWP
jgi:Methyltransferase domain